MDTKFRKIITIGIDKSALDSIYWQRIELLADKIASYDNNSPKIKNELNDTDCLLVGFGIIIDRQMIDDAPNLKYIGVLATAYGKIDVEYAKRKGISVCNIPGYATEAVAEFVFATILEHIRETERGKSQARRGNYSEADFSAIEIKDKVFGILGLGRIGNRVAEIASGFGADVRYWNIEKVETKFKYEDVDLLIPQCDFLSLHFAQVKETENFLNKERINKIKKGAIVINTAPMELVDIDALVERLKDGDIIFILDHSDEMSKESIEKLSKLNNCIIYPPIAYTTKEARAKKQEIFVSDIESFLKGSLNNQAI